MQAAMLENIERELEMAAQLLEINPGAEAESGSKLMRYLDVLTFEQGAWQKRWSYQRPETRADAIRLRDELKRQWQPWAQSQNIPLAVRCFTLSPTTNQWVDCQSFSG